MNRRNFVNKTMLGIGLSAGIIPVSFLNRKEFVTAGVPENSGFKISVFSKNLQWLDYTGMAQTAAALGFDGVDLTVRPGGHVSPEHVSEDLPKAMDAVKKAGLNIFSIVTAIEDADDPLTEPILKTASALGIRHYRLGWFHYDGNVSIADNLQRIREKINKLEVLNARYGIAGCYQNHSGKYFGAAVWDLAQVLKEIHAKYTGSQYDVYHASIEGANSWIYGFEAVAPYIKTVNIKDYQWTKKNGKWSTESVPLGTGAIDFDTYFSLLKKFNISCPLSVHYEYPLGTADQGGRTLTIEKEKVLEAMKKDLQFLKLKMKQNGLTQ